ncbi:MAG: hypothetical protein CL849_04800 [Crocinitomicaceae bacterium]|nr:hypothetical protein [Crocinitomicaceae bacterium]
MEWLEVSAEWRSELFWSSVIAMVAGIAFTASQLDRGEWRKWRQWRLLEPKTALSPIWILATVICLLAVLIGYHDPLWSLGALIGLGSLWVILDRLVRQHTQREGQRRKSEIAHWHTRLRAEHWLAQQSLIKRRELARVQADSLRHLMDPHFLFNALNGVMHDFLQDERDAGLSHLRAFRRLAVDQIETGRGGWLTLEREWSMLKDYIQLELRRINRPVKWRLYPLPDHIKSREIPAFMIQPLVENALWHGLGGTALLGSGTLDVEARLGGMDRAIILVRNSRRPEETDLEGRPINRHVSPRRRRHAMDLIRQRLALMGGDSQDALELETTETETRAQLILPCRQNLWRMS